MEKWFAFHHGMSIIPHVMKKDAGAVSLRSIARKTGFSVPTVVQVLGTRGHLYKESTRQRVLAAANEMGYRPNTSARAMRSGRFNGVGLLLSTNSDRSHLPVGLLEGIQAGLAGGDMHLSLSPLPDEKLTSGEIPKIVRQQMVDGLLINYTDHIPSRLIELIADHQIPSIWLNTDRADDAIRPDDYGASKRATEALLQLGHRSIWYVDYHNSHGDVASHYSAGHRYLGYADAMQAASIEPHAIWENESLKPKDRIAQAAKWIQKEDRPTAVVCYSPWTAMPVLLAATTLCGLRVPGDLSIVTFSDQMFGDIGVSMSTMLIPEAELGKQAGEMLMTKIEEPERKLATRVLPFVFDAGDTRGPPRAK
ncbi:LacI family DNA-binding transcriptional regulator [soil metagenome]